MLYRGEGMNDLIKEMRSFVKMSQQELADALGVTFATINRWENEKTRPNKLAQMKLYDFCKQKNVPIYDMMVKKMNREVEEINIPKNHILLYHGSKSGIKGKISPISRDKCDFGKGFYMGTDPLQPLTLVCDYEKAKFYILSISLDHLYTLDIPVNLEWAMIVAYNRGKMKNIQGSSLYEKYRKFSTNIDIVIGSIADDRMFYVLDSFFHGNITDMALIHSLSALQLGKQYVAISQKSCDAIRIEKEIDISYLEKRFLQDMSEENRAKGISIANDICKDYRREGLYFDEIIGGMMND